MGTAFWQIPVLLLSVAMAGPVLADDGQAQDRWARDQFATDLIHSPFPIYDFSWEDFWPRNFSDVTGFGCTTRVSFGDWEFQPGADNKASRGWWVRASHYGVFHCAANLRESDKRDSLDVGEFSRGFFAKIGEVGQAGSTTELWVLQKGFRTGSDYWLLSRPAGGEVVTSFAVLQRRCLPDAFVEKDNFDSWLTGYCWVETHEQLLALAQLMLEFPPLGQLTLKD
jgi:hypothetical protein